nr:MAG TPA: hypothetical protein [Bacteriophage sp.]
MYLFLSMNLWLEEDKRLPSTIFFFLILYE